MLLGQLEKRGIIKPPEWLVSNTVYLTLHGSQAYGVSTPESDFDVYGVVLPKKEVLFPHLIGKIQGWDRDIPRFDQWEASHVMDEQNDKEYDFNVYNIVKYFYLCRDGNPNMIDSLFTAEDCVLHCNAIGRIIRDNRKLFLSKKCWHTFRGYSWSQWNKAKKEKPVGKRKAIIEKYGFDIKFSYHLCRLLDEVQQILENKDLDLRLNNDYYISIRSGNVPWAEIEVKFFEKQKSLEALYEKSDLPYAPDDDKLKRVLLDCLEHHFGSLEKAVTVVAKEEDLLRQIKKLVESY